MLFIVLLVVFGIFGGKAVMKYRKELNAFKIENNRLLDQIANRDNEIKIEKIKSDKLEKSIDSLMKIFNEKGKQVNNLIEERDRLLATLNNEGE